MYSELQLSCDSGLLVIEGAIFRSTGTQTLLNCSGIEQHSRQDGSRFHLLQGDLDIHRELNRRCSGFSAATDCRFNLILDSIASKAWGPGIVEVWHRCVPNKLIQKKCGTEVSHLLLHSRTQTDPDCQEKKCRNASTSGLPRQIISL